MITRSVDQLPKPCVERLQRFVELLDRWRRITNLVSDRSFSDVWERHIQDSLHIQAFGDSANRWLDLGSGAGFPGIVIGVQIADRRLGQVHCVESDARKCAFLRTVAYELNIPVKVHNMRAENITPDMTGPIDVITARGFSSLAAILALSEDYLSGGAMAILPRGHRSARDVETLDASRYIATVKPNPGRKGGLVFLVRKRVRKP